MSAEEFRRYAHLRTGARIDHDTPNRALSGVLKHYRSQERLEAEIKLESAVYDSATKRTNFQFSATQGPTVKVKVQGVSLSQERIRHVIRSTRRAQSMRTCFSKAIAACAISTSAWDTSMSRWTTASNPTASAQLPARNGRDRLQRRPRAAPARGTCRRGRKSLLRLRDPERIAQRSSGR